MNFQLQQGQSPRSLSSASSLGLSSLGDDGDAHAPAPLPQDYGRTKSKLVCF